MTTELCTYTRNACDIARRTGVERIELCAAPLEGGTTPAAGLIRYFRGKHLVVINMSPTQTDSQADLLIADKIGKVLGQL